MSGLTEPRILIYDLETAPDISYTFGPKWQTNVSEYKQPWFILSCAWKWLGENRTYVLGLDDYRDGPYTDADDLELVEVIGDLFDQADITVTHNGVAFDGPKAATRLLVHGFDPPSPAKHIDTCKIARKEFGFQSNRLADIAKFLKLPAQKAHDGGFQTWLDCMAGDEKAWRRMKRYNKQDVIVLEQIYLKFRPWVTRHPNVSALEDRPTGCPRCGVEGQMVARKRYWNSSTWRRQYKCGACGGYSLGRTLVKTTSQFVTV